MSAAKLVRELGEWKSRFGNGQAKRVVHLLRQLARRNISDSATLIEFHEILLFLRAYPASVRIARLADQMLSGFALRIKRLERARDDLGAFEEAEVSGIAGTHLSAIFSYTVARHLVERHGSAVRIDWERHEQADRLVGTLPHLTPLMDDDAMVEASVPWQEWIETAAGGKGRDLPWLLESIARQEPTERLREDRYQAFQIPLRWDFGDSAATRTRMRLPAPRIFRHTEPLIRRADVSLAAVPTLEPLPSKKVTPAKGAELLALARDTSAARFRELHGFTHGAPNPVHELDAGRGVVFYLSGLQVEHRLPLRAYHAATIWKNGVPIGYLETLSLFDRLEAGFNLYYTFREGETAWLYRQLLRMCRQFLGVSSIAIDAYQIGHDNEEAIESGAYWFYRKLGFRSVDPDACALTAREEERIASRPTYRSSAATLRKLVRSPMVYEFPGSGSGTWDQFHPRRLGLAASCAMARRYGGDLVRMRQEVVRTVWHACGWKIERWNDAERRVLAEWAPLLALLPDIGRWTAEERRLLGAILKAKAGTDESDYLRLMQQHARLRAAVVRLGSRK